MENSQDRITFQVKEETLDINKNWVQIGEVKCRKDILTEQKTITVPILREELVIEKNYTDAESTDQSIRTETIRIPTREERVEILKHTYDLEKVEIYKHDLHQTEVVDAFLKKEIVHIKTSGDVDLEIV